MKTNIFLYTILIISLLCLIIGIIGYYVSMKLDLVYFLCLDIPFYCFALWALYMAIKIYKNSKNL